VAEVFGMACLLFSTNQEQYGIYDQPPPPETCTSSPNAQPIAREEGLV
jgi:hypothetical protein